MFVEDFAPFMSVYEFASSATLAGTAVQGLFDNAYGAFDMGGDVAGSGPTFTLPTASVPGVVVGTNLVVNAVTYKVTEHHPDGTGLSLLRLRT
jgi:hypothetical protein